MDTTRQSPVWIFGYGSLVWRPAFSHARRHPACITGWARRFWQGSPDHRGQPERPGRVVTLVPSPGEHCAGVAYQVASDEVDAVFGVLDHRERGGYERRQVTIRLAHGQRMAGVTYIAPAHNRHYLGPAPLAAIARQVLASAGASGPNDEYVLALARALRDNGAVDRHLFSLEKLVLAARRQVDPIR